MATIAELRARLKKKRDFLGKPNTGVIEKEEEKPVVELKQKPAPKLDRKESINVVKQMVKPVTHELPEEFQPTDKSGRTLGDVLHEKHPDTMSTLDRLGSDIADLPFKTFLGASYDLSKNIGDLTHINSLTRSIDDSLNKWGYGSDFDFHVNGVTNGEWDDEKDLFYMGNADPNSFRNKILAGKWFTEEPENNITKIARPIISFGMAQYFAGTMLPLKVASTATKTQKVAAEVAKDTIAGFTAFPLSSKRALEYLTDITEGTPLDSDIGRAVNNLIRADEDTPELVQTLQVAVDTIFVDVALRGFGGIAFKSFSAIASIGRAKRLKRREVADQLAEDIANATAQDIQKLVGPMGTKQRKEVIKAIKLISKEQKKKKTARSKIKGGTKKIRKDEIVLPSKQVLNDAISIEGQDLLESLSAVLSGVHKDGSKVLDSFRVFNLDSVSELGMHQTVELLAALYRKKKLFTKSTTQGGMTPKRKFLSTNFFQPKNQAALQKEAEVIAGGIKGAQSAPELQFAATLHGVSVENLRKRMSSKYDSIAGMESELFAYRIILRDLGIDFSRKLNIPGAIENPKTRASLLNDFQQLSDLFTLHSHIGATVGRSLAQFGIKLPKSFVDKTGKLLDNTELTKDEIIARNAFIDTQLNKNGVDKEFFEMMKFAFYDTDLPIHKAIKLALKGSEALYKKSMGGILEAFRAQLLSSFKVFEQAAVSGTIETFYAPLSDLLGSSIRAGFKAPFTKSYKDDLLVAQKAAYRLKGIYDHFRPATLKALKAFRDEKNILDPLRTVIDDSGLKTGHYIESSSKWLGWLVNSTGAGIRMPLRGLGAMDELLKQVNYASWAYGEIMINMPKAIKRGKKGDKLNYIDSQMAKYYDEFGRGTNEAGVNYARETIFQETLEAGKIVQTLDKAIRKSRFLEFWLPIRRTPANVVKRMINRHEGFLPLRAEVRRKWLHGTPEEKAKVMGDTILAGGMMTTVWSYLGDGIITGAGPRDPNRREAWERTHKPYSIKIGDEWYPYDRYAPVTGAMMIMADIYENAWEYNEHKDNLAELAMLGFLQSLGNMHFVGNFYDVFEAMQDAHNNPKNLMSLITKPFEKAGVVPKYVEQSAHFFTGTEGFKEAQNAIEKYQVSEMGVRKLAADAAWNEYDGDEYDYLTGKLVQRSGDGLLGRFQDISGMLPKNITKTKYDLVWNELEKMGAHLAAPQRFWGSWKGNKVGVQLTVEQFSEYKRLMGTIRASDPRHPKWPKKTLIETLHDVIADIGPDGKPLKKRVYKWDSTASYPPIVKDVHTGDPDPRIGLLQGIMTTYREAARSRLPFIRKANGKLKFPGLIDVLLHRVEVIKNNNRLRDTEGETPKQIPPITQVGYEGHWLTELIDGNSRVTDTFRLTDQQKAKVMEKYGIDLN